MLAPFVPLQVKIQALDFSCDEQFLASLGGPDDNSLVRVLGSFGACLQGRA